jgi:hypothetical protein
MTYYETSAKNSLNVSDAFEDIARKAVSNSEARMYFELHFARRYDSLRNPPKSRKLLTDLGNKSSSKCKC